MGDEEIQIEIIPLRPKRHTKWAVICPLLDLAANIAGDIELAFRQWSVFATQNGMQVDYDRKFKEITK